MQVGQFKAIIFDLGGVIINLDEEKTVAMFSLFSRLSEEKIRGQILTFDEYKQFEMGKISQGQFRDALRTHFQLEAPDEKINQCMNAMLLDIPTPRLDLLTRLKNSFKLFLLSNTNEIHLESFNEKMGALTGHSSIDHYFDRAYYSHLMGLRKPDPLIFGKIVLDNDLVPSETLFLDDNVTNLEGARSVGIQTYHINTPTALFDLFT